MLASLLPGFRELRTPLAIGYLYALALYLLVGDKIPPRATASQHLKPLYDVAHWLGKPATLAAGAFVVFLLGSVLEVSAATLSRLIGALVGGVGTPNAMRPDARRLVWGVGGQLTLLSANRLSTYCRYKVMRNIPVIDGFDGLVVEARRRLVEDLPQLPTRLYTASKDMYGDYDRLVAEADLRVNVGLAGALLSCVMAHQVHMGWLLVIIPMVLLAYRGLVTIRKANDILVQAIITDLVQPPSFEEYVSGLGTGTPPNPGYL
ncbi:hypothetical protein ACFYWH_44245 [Streptomyces sp. NPDC003737]|uniref:hypothetical protein n=1 Tax=Streptomyces sp. NPDC003737 TaxID=3364685 RepID=UPI003683A83D